MTGLMRLFLALCCLAAACYNYRPLAPRPPAPDAFLAITLTDAGSEELFPYVGPNVAVVRGRFLTTTERGLAVSVAAVETHRGDVQSWRGETVLVPREFIATVDERRVSASRTALLAGASLLGLVATYEAFGSGGGGAGGRAGTPAPR